jgi:hypothetical protein
VKGVIGEGILAGVLRELYVGRKTGILRFTQGSARRTVRFVKGSIVHAASEVPDERLGEVLVRLGRLSSVDLDRASELVREGKRLGVALTEMGVFDRGNLEDALAMHAHEILRLIFEDSTEGTYEFEEAQDEMVPGRIHLEALDRGDHPGGRAPRAGRDVVRYALGDFDRVLTLSNDPLLRFQRITLSPTDGFILSRIDGTLSAREVMQLITLPEAEVQRSLFGLLCTGVVEQAAGPPKAPPKAVAPRRPPAPAPEPPRAPAPVVAPPPGPSPDTETKRREIAEAHEAIRTKTHFEVLGIERTATEAQIKEAYFRLARRFHPDMHHAPNMADLRDKLETVFIRLGEAYGSSAARAAARPTGRPRQPRPQAARSRRRAASPAAPPPPMEPAAALLSLKKAQRLIIEEKFWDAIQLLEPAIPALEGKPKQRARLELAQAYTKNPNWIHQAEETLHEVVREDPRNVEAYMALGHMYKAGGLRSRAVGMFRKVVELRPEHEDAMAELTALGPEPEAPESSGGFLKNLFGRK